MLCDFREAFPFPMESPWKEPERHSYNLYQIFIFALLSLQLPNLY